MVDVCLSVVKEVIYSGNIIVGYIVWKVNVFRMEYINWFVIV